MTFSSRVGSTRLSAFVTRTVCVPSASAPTSIASSVSLTKVAAAAVALSIRRRASGLASSLNPRPRTIAFEDWPAISRYGPTPVTSAIRNCTFTSQSIGVSVGEAPVTWIVAAWSVKLLQLSTVGRSIVNSTSVPVRPAARVRVSHGTSVEAVQSTGAPFATSM